jgi:hypothetical protein
MSAVTISFHTKILSGMVGKPSCPAWHIFPDVRQYYYLLLTTMAIALDRCIQRTHSTATHNLEHSPSLGEIVVLKAKPAGLWHAVSSYVPSPPSPVDDTESSMTQKISSPSIEISLLDDVNEFIKARDPGTYKVTFHLPFLLTRTNTYSRNSTQWRSTTSSHSKINWI